MLNENKYVIVNIWPSKKNKALNGENVGHVSLLVHDGLHETYISLWPGSYQTAKIGIFAQASPAYIQNYERDCLLEAHSEKLEREISDITECLPGETPYLYNKDKKSYEKLTFMPKTINPKEIIEAIKLIPASFRMVLYSLDVSKIKEKFEDLKKANHISGWSMYGSNLFTRNFNKKTTESCASIAYRCLNAGGLYDQIHQSKASSPLLLAVAPDDLLRLIVSVKINESKLYSGDRKYWKVAGLDETLLKDVIAAYDAVGESANAEEDCIPRSKPSIVECNLI